MTDKNKWEEMLSLENYFKEKAWTILEEISEVVTIGGKDYLEEVEFCTEDNVVGFSGFEPWSGGGQFNYDYPVECLYSDIEKEKYLEHLKERLVKAKLKDKEYLETRKKVEEENERQEYLRLKEKFSQQDLTKENNYDNK